MKRIEGVHRCPSVFGGTVVLAKRRRLLSPTLTYLTPGVAVVVLAIIIAITT